MSSLASKSAIMALDAINGGDFQGDELARLAVRDAARRLVARLETPSEQTSRYAFDHPVVFAAIQTLIDLGIWEAWTAAGAGEEAVDGLVKIAKKHVEPGLLRRLLRLLAANNIISEVGEDRYKPTPFSAALSEKDGGTWKFIQAGTHHYLDAGRNLPSFLQKTNYKETTDHKNTAYSDMPANPDHLEFFARCQSQPTMYESFGGHMADWTLSKRNWTDTFDTQMLLDGADLTTGPFIVDMGGHYGIDISRVLERHRDLPAGALVLQDLPEVISVARDKVDAKIKSMEYDLFKPQPIQGSRAYFMHAILHDWPDDAVLAILKNLTPAMKKGYSKLLVCDIVIPPTGASVAQTVMDVQMMALLAAMERTQAHWTELLTKGGFKNIKFHPDGRGLECVVEADLG